MTITIDCRHIGKSGIGTFIEGVANSMIAEHPENTYLLIVEKVLQEYLHLPNVKQMACDIKPFTLKELFCFPVHEINKNDAFFSPYINIPFGIKVPVYSTIHDVIFWDKPELVSTIGLWMRTFYVKHAISASKTIFTVSEFSRGRIYHHFGTKKPVKVCYSAISSYIKQAANDNTHKKDYFIFVGNIKRHKGLAVLLKAFSQAQKEGLKDKLYIVGEKNRFRSNDSEFESLLNSVSDVEFTGYLNNEDLIKYIQEAKALVLPTFYEGLGLPPMEALYLGTDAIISDIDVFKEIYNGMPVTRFRVGDSKDLAEKLLKFEPISFNIDDVRREIDKTFNFSKVTEKILQIMKDSK